LHSNRKYSSLVASFEQVRATSPESDLRLIFDSLQIPHQAARREFLLQVKKELGLLSTHKESSSKMCLRSNKSRKDTNSTNKNKDPESKKPCVQKPTQQRPQKTKRLIQNFAEPPSKKQKFNDDFTPEERAFFEGKSTTIDLTCETATDHYVTSDLEMALKLQAEFDRETPVQKETFECPICYEQIPIDQQFLYSNCPHTQCRDCVTTYFTRQIENQVYPITCVLCKQPVAFGDLELLLPESLLAKYQLLSQTGQKY